MKQLCLVVILLMLLGVTAFAAPPSGSKSPVRMVTALDYEAYIDANNIFMFVTNQGSYGRDLAGVYGYDFGTFFPYNGLQFIADGSLVASPLYAAGLWAGAIDSATGEKLITVAEYNSEYMPGPITTVTPIDQAYYDANVANNDEYKVYKLYKDSMANNPNDDYLNWPVDQGAPVDSLGNPSLIGDQMTWSVYHDWHNVSAFENDAGTTPGLGIEVRQTTFAFDREGPLGNCIFVKFQIFNKGNKVLKNCYFSLWADPDLGTSSDDLVGVDTLTGLGYIYNATKNDGDYAQIAPNFAPPALGFDFFQGPLIFTGNENDTAKAFDTLWPGYRNAPMASFNKYINGTDPNDFQETYNYMQGLNSDGSPTANGTTFQVPGDPVGHTGDLDIAPADRRMMQSTGPITFRPGDSTEIVAGMVVGWYKDQLSSISFLRYYDIFAQSAYEQDFVIPEPPAPPIVSVAQLNQEISLSWTDTSEIDHGDYPFEGYTVYQGASRSGPWTQIANYAVLGVDVLDLTLDPISGQLETKVVKDASDQKVRRYIQIDRDYVNGGDLDNGTTYYFQVEAYSYDGFKTPKILQAITLATATPQGPPADVDIPTNYGDTLPVAHVGSSDGVITPFVVDPNLLNGHEYEVTFVSLPDTTIVEHFFEIDTTRFFSYDTLLNICFITTDFDTIYCVDTILDSLNFDTLDVPGVDTIEAERFGWNLRDVTIDSILVDSQFNQTDDENYLVFDGILVKVGGPPKNFKSFQTVANANGPIDPPVPGAFGGSGFPTPGGGNPPTDQQANGSRWIIHTADNGGSSGGGTRGGYDAFLSRTTRDGANWPNIIPHDYEIRFTDNENYGIVEADFGYAADYLVPVTFELWDIGVNTPNNLADDIRLIPFLLENDDDGTFNLSAYGAGNEHSASGGDNDPFTDWIYMCRPIGAVAGEAAYNAAVAAVDGGGDADFAAQQEILARMVFVSWNAVAVDSNNAPPWIAPLPEEGTIFRITTNKPNTVEDVFTWTASMPTAAPLAAAKATLDKIVTVPNPFYLFSTNDPAVGNYQLQFHHLPKKCTISIYSLSGELIETIDKNDETDRATWDLLTSNRLPVASGIYLWVVDAPGVGQKIGKMAVFTETEVIDKY